MLIAKPAATMAPRDLIALPRELLLGAFSFPSDIIIRRLRAPGLQVLLSLCPLMQLNYVQLNEYIYQRESALTTDRSCSFTRFR